MNGLVKVLVVEFARLLTIFDIISKSTLIFRRIKELLLEFELV